MKGLIPAVMAPRDFFGVPNAKPAPGLTWVSIPSPTLGEAIVGINYNGLDLFLADDLGNVYELGDGGHTWFFLSNTGSSGEGNIQCAGATDMLYGGTGAPLMKSTDGGNTWAPITATPDSADAFTVYPGNAGVWAGWASANDANNHGGSADGGSTWNTPGAGGFPPTFNTIVGDSPNCIGFDGLNFFAALQGIVASSGDGLTWTQHGTLNGVSSITFVGNKYIAGEAGTPNNSIILVSTTLLGLSTTTQVPVPIPSGDNITGLAGSTSVGAYVCGS